MSGSGLVDRMWVQDMIKVTKKWAEVNKVQVQSVKNEVKVTIKRISFRIFIYFQN